MRESSQTPPINWDTPRVFRFFSAFLPKDLHVDSFYRIYTIERVKRASPLNLLQDIPLSEVRLYDL